MNSNILNQSRHKLYTTDIDSIFFKKEFNEQLYDYIEIIKNYKKLIFDSGSYFNQPIKELIGHKTKLQNLEIIFFGYSFNQPIHDIDWKNLTNLQELTFGSEFNQKIKGLDDLINLQKLSFGHAFNQSIEELKWKNLINLYVLSFGYSFNKPIDGLFDSCNLRELTFGHTFNCRFIIKNYKCGWINLCKLIFGSEFNQPIVIQDTILNKNLNFVSEFNLEILIFERNFNQSIEVIRYFKKLKILVFGYEFSQHVEGSIWKNLSNLEILSFEKKFSHPLNREFAGLLNLRHLTLRFDSVQHVELPLNIKYLSVNSNNQHLIDSLSNNIKHLDLDEKFNLELNNLPTSIERLTIKPFSIYNKPLNNLPMNLQYLQLNHDYNCKIENIPKNLNELVCSKNYKYIGDFKNVKITYYKRTFDHY